MAEVKLKVMEALQEEAYKGIVRIDAQNMREMNIRPGDIVEIEGIRKTVGIADRAYPTDIGQNVIRMDGILRRNAKTSLGENIIVRKAEVKEAISVTIAPAQTNISIQADPLVFKRGLLGRPVLKGDQIALGGTTRRKTTMTGSPFEDIFDFFEQDSGSPFGFGKLKSLILNTEPKNNAVIITENTKLNLKSKIDEIPEEKVIDITYEDVGGLTEEIKKIREMVELPLKHPEIFERLGIQPPKGVLLHGPPGTGKTLLAKAVANETNAQFIHLDSPAVMSKYVGEAERKIRSVFQEAEKNAPSIIFIDEIDAIAIKREESYGEVERRVVAQLLATMDGLKARGKVIVIAATNRPNSIDPALRRPGRFDREIEIGVPKPSARLDILKIHTRTMPLNEDVNLKEIADLTHGFVGADLESLCKEAAMIVLRRLLPDIQYKKEEPIPKEILEKLIISDKDLKEALKVVRPSALREVFIETPNISWEDIGGLEKLKQDLKEAVELPLKHPEVFKNLGIKPPKGILMYGPPGTGKTLLAKAVAKESEANFILIKGAELLCLDGNTNVFTDFCGVRKISEVYDNMKKISKIIKKTQDIEIRKIEKPAYGYALNEKGKIIKTKINKIYKLWVDETYKLKFKDNNELIISKNQPLYTFRDGEIKWIKTEDLKEGDFVAKPTKIPFFNKEIKIELPKYKHLKLIKEDNNYYHTKIFSTKQITKLPKKLDKNLASFLGWFVAEGNISKGDVVICNTQERNKEEIKKLFEIFTEKERIQESKKKVAISSTPLVKYLENIFEMKLGAKKSHSIIIPSIISKSNKEIISSFINALYKGDGHIDNQKIEYGTMSKKVAEVLSYLLLNFEIKNKYWQRSDGMHLITISGQREINKFKNSILNENNSLEVRNEYNAQYIIPPISKYLKYCKEKLNIYYDKEVKDGSFEHIISGRRKCGLLRLKKLMVIINKYATKEFKKDKIFNNLQKIATSDLSWTSIKCKTKAEPRIMYDFETEHGSFIGGKLPIILHNSKWVGDSEKAVKKIFEKARQTSPTIIFFDEIDAIVPKRGRSHDSGVTERVVNQMLTEIDGLIELNDVLVIGATNRPDIIDPALLRPGRFDRIILTQTPDEKARLSILKIHTKNTPLASDIDLNKIAKETENYVGADLESLCKEAGMLALREDINAKEVKMKHFKEALKKVRASVTEEDIKKYEEIEANYIKTARGGAIREKDVLSYMG